MPCWCAVPCWLAADVLGGPPQPMWEQHLPGTSIGWLSRLVGQPPCLAGPGITACLFMLWHAMLLHNLPCRGMTRRATPPQSPWRLENLCTSASGPGCLELASWGSFKSPAMHATCTNSCPMKKTGQIPAGREPRLRSKRLLKLCLSPQVPGKHGEHRGLLWCAGAEQGEMGAQRSVPEWGRVVQCMRSVQCKSMWDGRGCHGLVDPSFLMARCLA